jgi:4-hydroxy-tetrahydrodipicolinate synthase
MNFKEKLRGTGVALITPFTNDDQVDYEALERLIEFQIDNGVNYFISLGTTGETPVLTKAEKKEIVVFTYKVVKGRVPVVVGIGGNNTKELIEDLSYYPLEEAVAVLSASPYYNKPSQEGIFQHYKALAAVSPKPIILYNVPGRTGRNMTAATTLKLAALDNIAGMKEASGDMIQCMEILKDCPDDFLVVSGDDALALPQIACGMSGVISVAGNALPALFTQMVNAALKGDFAAAKKANDQLMPAYDLMFAENNPAGVKAFLTESGIIKNNLRLPVVPLSAELHEKVKTYLQTYSS